MSVTLKNGKKSVAVEKPKNGNVLWSFYENGQRTTGLRISKEVFEMMRELTTNHKVVEMYENNTL